MSVRRVAVGLGLLLVLGVITFVGWCLAEDVAYWRHVKPHGKTLQELVGQLHERADEKPWCNRVFDKQRRKYAVCISPRVAPRWVGTSGPAEYVFDQHGRLIQFILDNGDAPVNMTGVSWHEGEPIADATAEFR